MRMKFICQIAIGVLTATSESGTLTATSLATSESSTLTMTSERERHADGDERARAAALTATSEREQRRCQSSSRMPQNTQKTALDCQNCFGSVQPNHGGLPLAASLRSALPPPPSK